jgi:hypothetical protein
MQDSRSFAAARRALLAIALVLLACTDEGPEITGDVDLQGIIQGVVRYNDTDHPAAGVRVRLIGHGMVRDTTTSSDGSFRFMHTAAGVFTLEVMPPAGYRGDTLTVDFNGAVRALPPVALARVSGSVVGSVRAVLGDASGVTVHLTHMESNTHRTTTTGADGSFTFEEVAVGTVRVSVDPTMEAFAPPVVVSLQTASVVAPTIAFLPRSALRPIAYVRCVQWGRDWEGYEYCAHHQLSVSNSDGTGARAVHDGVGSRPSWSPDGQQLVFTGQGGRLHLIDLSGSGLVELSPFTGMLTPVWSPGGDRILFAGSQSFSPLYFGTLPGFDITAVPNTEGAEEPALSPDGSRIAFAVAGALKVVNTDGSGVITLLSSDAAYPTWSPDGQRIGFHPTWSPDGQRIAFTEGGDIKIIGANGGSPTSVGPGYCPEWSPDGSVIAASGVAEAKYLDGVVVASLSVEGAFSCTQTWSPVAAVLP